MSDHDHEEQSAREELARVYRGIRAFHAELVNQARKLREAADFARANPSPLLLPNEVDARVSFYEQRAAVYELEASNLAMLVLTLPKEGK